MIDTKNEGMIVGTISLENRTLVPPRKFFAYKAEKLPFTENKKTIDSLAKSGHYEDFYGSVVIQSEDGDFFDEKKAIYYFTIVKPAGNYHFYNLRIFLNTGYMQSTQLIPLNIPFEIEKGKVNYLGEIKYNVKNGTVEVINKIERDRLKFKEKFPEIKF